MAKEQAFDFSKATEQFFGAFNVDTKAFEDAVKNSSEFNAKLSKIALDAAKKNFELSTAWTTEALKKADAANKVQASATDYSTVASEQAQALPEKVAAFVEVAKQAQLDAVELFVSAGKDIQADVVAASKDMAGKTKAA